MCSWSNRLNGAYLKKQHTPKKKKEDIEFTYILIILKLKVILCGCVGVYKIEYNKYNNLLHITTTIMANSRENVSQSIYAQNQQMGDSNNSPVPILSATEDGISNEHMIQYEKENKYINTEDFKERVELLRQKVHSGELPYMPPTMKRDLITIKAENFTIEECVKAFARDVSSKKKNIEKKLKLKL